MGDFERVTANLIVVPKKEADGTDPARIIDGEAYSFFRGYSGGAFYIREGAPSQLEREDVEAINARCDDKEKFLNRRVKKNVAAALCQYFGEMAFQIYEFGCGRFPITRHFNDTSRVSYHGIECDRGHVTELHSMGIPASDWEVVMKDEIPDGKPSVSVAVYALHFMVDEELPERIKHLTSKDTGFFVGNFYSDPAEKLSNTQRNKLGTILEEAGLSYVTLGDPDSKSSQYWIIGRCGDVGNIHRFAKVLEESVKATATAYPVGRRYRQPA